MDDQSYFSIVGGVYRTHDTLQEAIEYERFHTNGLSNWDGHPLTKGLSKSYRTPGLPSINKLFRTKAAFIIGETVLLLCACMVLLFFTL